MILAISRFRVANGMEANVVQAFLERPRLVDHQPGFLGLEVFTDTRDPTVFHLVTRWTDVTHYERWHKSDEHRLSHQGIPKGLKLDARFTELLILDRLEPPDTGRSAEHTVFDAAPFLASFLEASERVCLILGDRDGRMTAVNDAAARALDSTPAALIGAPLWSVLVASDVEPFRARLRDEKRRPEERTLLHFSTTNGVPFTLSCQVDVQPDYFVLVGEPPAAERRAETTLMQLNNELAVLNREHARTIRQLEETRAELEATLDELQTSYWHLRKIQEVLPICMSCGKVKTGEGAQWQSVVDYLKDNALFLSHGYCPRCATAIEAQLDRDLRDL